MSPLLVFYFLIYSLAAQSGPVCEKCDMETVRITRENISALTFERVQDFLCIFDESCAGDYEFYRASNETLFDVVYKAPETFLKVLQFGELKNHELIFEELGAPAHAGIDVEVIRARIKEQDEKYMFKYDVLSALD